MKNRSPLTWAIIGFAIALITSPFLYEWISLLIPVAAVALGTRKTKHNIPEQVIPVAAPNPEPPLPKAEAKPKAAVISVDPEIQPVQEYLEVLEDMVISEGQQQNLDDEIVEKSLALFARLQRVLPLLQELNNPEINHTIRRLVLRDLNGFISPFLRLGGEAKTKNRRMLLNGLKDINSKITSIVETVEHKDLVELQTRADLIHQRYHSGEKY